jgi:hypothetical protein
MMLGFGATGLLPAGAGNLIPFRREGKAQLRVLVHRVAKLL